MTYFKTVKYATNEMDMWFVVTNMASLLRLSQSEN